MLGFGTNLFFGFVNNILRLETKFSLGVTLSRVIASGTLAYRRVKNIGGNQIYRGKRVVIA